jgi:hypothetical protein
MPKGLGGKLYLDVLTDAGTAYHLLPEPMNAANELPPGGRVRVGVEAEDRALDVRHWQVGPPFGAAYLVAVASERPLSEEPRPLEEPLAAYLPVLLAGLADPATGGKAARVQRIEFRPRD